MTRAWHAFAGSAPRGRACDRPRHRPQSHVRDRRGPRGAHECPRRESNLDLPL